MKKYFVFLVIAAMMAACSKDATEELLGGGRTRRHWRGSCRLRRNRESKTRGDGDDSQGMIYMLRSQGVKVNAK